MDVRAVVVHHRTLSGCSALSDGKDANDVGGGRVTFYVQLL
jgi:hypothetical protein